MAAAKGKKIRIRLKGYDHNVVDKAAEKIVKLQSAQALRFQVLFRFPLRRKLLLSFVQFISTRTAVNSLSRERTKGLLTF